MPVDHERVGIGCYLRRDPGSQSNERGGQSLAQPKDPLEARDGDLYVLSGPVPPFGALGGQKDVYLCQSLPQLLASVGARSPKSFLATSSPKATSASSSSLKETSATLAAVSS